MVEFLPPVIEQHGLAPRQSEQYPGTQEVRRYLEEAILNPGWELMFAADSPEAQRMQRIQRLLPATLDPNGRFGEFARFAEAATTPPYTGPADVDWRMAAINASLQDRPWDSRRAGNKERHQVGAQADVDLPGSVRWNLTFRGATALGLVESSTPRNRRPTIAAVAGGRGLAFKTRAEYLLGQLDSFEHLVFLGSPRRVDDAERALLKGYEGEIKDEAAIARAYLERELNAEPICSYETEDGGMAHDYRFIWHGQTKLATVLDTPPGVDPNDPAKRRANSNDNFKALARWANLEHHPEVTIVGATTGLYRLFQEAIGKLELTLRYGVQFEMIGHSAEYSGVKRLASQLRQETLAGWDHMKRLYQAVEELS